MALTELDPEQRLTYYQRAIELFQLGGTGKYSCNELAKMIWIDYGPQVCERETSEFIVRALLPEYYQVLCESERAVTGKWNRPLITAWPCDESGNKERRKALTEAIRRVSLLIK